MYTWLQTKNGIKSLLTDFIPSNSLYALAVANYVKAAVSREVDKDLALYKSYNDSFKDMKMRLLGFTSTLVVGGTLDVEVKKLLTVDANREGLSDFVTMQISLGAQEITTMNVLVDELIKQAAIDLQTYIDAYKCNNETIYTYTDVTAVGRASRGKFPEGGRVLDAYYERNVDALAISTAYEEGDLVLSNGHIFEVASAGTTPGSLGAGLTDTTGAIEYIGSVPFFYKFEKDYLKAPMHQVGWHQRFDLAAKLDTCCSKSDPAMFAVEDEAHSFFAWPGITDSEYVYRIFWNGIKFDFEDADYVPFDEAFWSAASDYVKAKIMREMNFGVSAVERREASYERQRAKLYSYHHSRAFLKHP